MSFTKKKRHSITKQSHKKKRNNHHHHITIQDDFYNVVNKDWINRHKTQLSKKPVITTFALLQDKVNKEIQDIILDKLKNNRQIVNLYKSYMTENDPLIEKYIYENIIELTQIQHTGNVYKLISWGIYKGLSQLIQVYIAADPKHPTQNICYIEEGGLNIEDPEKYHLKDRKVIGKYRKLLNDMFCCIFGVNHTYDIEKVIDIEKEMSKYIYSSNKPITTARIYNVFTVEEAKRKCHLDWNVLSNEYGLTPVPNKLVITNPSFITKAMLLLKKNWNKHEIYVYYIANILFGMSQFHSGLYKIVLDYCITDKTVQIPNKRKRALSFISGIMNTTINKTYLKYYKKTEEIHLVQYITSLIIKTYISRLKKNTWLSSETIYKAIEKIQHLRVTIGDKSKWIEDPDCDFQESDIYCNYMCYLNWKIIHFIKTFYKPIPVKNTWLKGTDMNTFDVNAEYNLTKNEIIIPNAILQPPFVDIRRSLSYNFATIGTLIGHEISHGFDNMGSMYNKDGVYMNWWTKTDFQSYILKQNMIKTLFYTVAKRDNFKVNPDLTLPENIADISGFLVAEETYIQLLIDNGIYGLEQKKHLILFYTQYAKIWRVVMHPKTMNKLYKTDVHSYAKYRVNCALLMSPYFKSMYGNYIQKENLNENIW